MENKIKSYLKKNTGLKINRIISYDIRGSYCYPIVDAVGYSGSKINKHTRYDANKQDFLKIPVSKLILK